MNNRDDSAELSAIISEFLRNGYEHADFSWLVDSAAEGNTDAAGVAGDKIAREKPASNETNVDKHELYAQAITACMETITPPAEALNVDSPVPAECMAHIVSALFTQLDTHREAVALLAADSLHPVLETGTTTAMMESSELGLHLDRVLLRGQEAGAFRPGISANDVFYIIISLSLFRLNHRHLMATTAQVDTLSASNSVGIRRLVIDAVLSFLTSNIEDSEHESYLFTSDEEHDGGGLGVYWD